MKELGDGELPPDAEVVAMITGNVEENDGKFRATIRMDSAEGRPLNLHTGFIFDDRETALVAMEAKINHMAQSFDGTGLNSKPVTLH